MGAHFSSPEIFYRDIACDKRLSKMILCRF
ncbi:hypothetical protein DS909_03730 [Phaeobacter gallaeciensis]|uniref:Uncharacterized protein n=2 Tax=Roseobacteraceae TaxID=2854170 RepID=A0A366XBH8_9RHOB|nr:YhjR family protein [Falsiruegeria litorea]MBT8169311.1 YhjR family protein [Falsiruegeria litorea]RBW60545.1 hypothetical protein DS909_03730 [Phaeobacter gallaeciensis]